MKNYSTFLRQKSLIFLMLISLLACEDNETNPLLKSVAEPKGTIALLVRNADNGGTRIEMSDCLGYLYMESDNNLKGYNHDYYYHTEWKISSIGKVKGLGNIKTIPETGWNNQVATFSNTGYVAVNINYSYNRVIYSRLFVDDYILNTDQEPIGASFRYHSPFNGDATEISIEKLQGEEYEQENYQFYQLQSPISWSIESDADWCKVAVVSEDIFSVYTPHNESEENRTATVTISSEGLEDLSFAVQQEGEKPLVNASEEIIYIDNTSVVKNIAFSSTADWTASSNADWCVVTTENGKAGSYQYLTIRTTANLNQDERGAIITISATNAKGNTTIDIKVIQDGGDFAGGEGTELNPYLISTPKHLNNIRKKVSSSNVYFKLINNIDMSDYLASTEKGWETLSNFRGVLDGDGYSIINIWNEVADYYEESQGFIYYNYGTIKNLGIEIAENKYLHGNRVDYFGVFASYNTTYGRIEKCYTKGNIKTNGDYSGGLVGSNQGTIIYSYVEGLIISDKEYYSRIGGIAGSNSSGTISNSYSIATINTLYANGSSFIGGLVADTWSGKIENCYMAGLFQTKSGDSVNPITDTDYNNINTYYDKSITGIENNDGMGRTTEQMKQQSTYQNWDFENVWRIAEGVSYPTLR